jgi:phage terminase large subunit-like protein
MSARHLNPPTAQIISIQRMICTGCGAEANASCNCGVSYMPKAARAAEAIANNPEMSNRAIAEKIGTDEKTVRKARKSTADWSAVRKGRDGKKRKQPVKKTKPAETPKPAPETTPPIGTDTTPETEEENAAVERAVLRKIFVRDICELTTAIEKKGAQCFVKTNLSADALIGGSFETACHLTGLYPQWWKGKRFDTPTKVWAAGETALAVRDICQGKLCGEPGVESSFGSGMIPKALFVDRPSLSRGVTDAYDTIQVRHVSGGVSICRFKSYEQGRSKFVGEGLDDEEPPLDIYSEGLTRLGERNGIAFMTFTPLDGPTAVVLRYTDEANADRMMVSMTLDDIPEDTGHLSAQAKAAMIAGYPEFEREARAMGIPMLGSGRIFTSPEETIREPRIADRDIPPEWFWIWGIDIGIGHPFAAVLISWDKDSDCVHIHRTLRMSDQTPIMHAAAMKRIGIQAPVAWPKDAGDRDRGTGIPVHALYKAEGLRMLGEPASHPPSAGARHQASTEAGIMEWDLREKSGRLKVAADLSDWFEERRIYHRKDGQIVKIKDDLLSATRIALMMKRHAKQVQLGPNHDVQAGMHRYAKGTPHNQPFDLFTGRQPQGGGGRSDFDIFSGKR